MTDLTKEQIRAIFARKKSLSIQAKGTIPITTKISKDKKLQGYNIEKIQGLPDTVVVRIPGESSGVLTTRKNLKTTLKLLSASKRFPRPRSSK
jgi:phosphoribosylformimino-5-aminoimidazole carboxamide ribonucleotide (ProFAR) isomerase